MVEINKQEIIDMLSKNKTIVTHFGDDLDNRSSIYALEELLKKMKILEKDEKLNVERVPAGKVKEGFLNVDTGGHTGCKYDKENQTIVIDGDPKNGIKSACEAISKLGLAYIPEQILECADALPTKISIMDTRSGMALQKFATMENVFKMAELGMLTRDLTEEELETFNLKEAQRQQQEMVNAAKMKVEKYTTVLANGEKVVIASEFVQAGSLVAYEMGVNYYTSIDKHKSGEGITLAINAKPGVKLPDNIKEFGNGIVEELKNEDGTSGAFLHPNGSMFVVGGPKNPDVKLNVTQEEMTDKISTLFEEYSKEDLKKQIESESEKSEDLIEQNKHVDIKEMKAKELKEEITTEYNKVNQQNKTME